jgi:glycosyltransferase involved in cell wall biosynthesis
MKKIVHVTTVHPTFDTRIFRNECVSLANDGYDVYLICPHDKSEVVDGVKIIPIIKYIGMYERLFTAPKMAINKALSIDADLYHFHDPELLLYFAKFAKKHNKNVVWDAHENYEETIAGFNSLKIKPISNLAAKWFAKAEMKFGKNLFKGVVTVNQIMASRYNKYGINVAEVGNFSNIDKLNYPYPNKNSDSIIFISSGFQFKERGIVEIAQAFNRFSENEKVELKYSGRFKSEEVRNEVISLINESNLSKTIIKSEMSWEELVLKEIPSSDVGFVLFDVSDSNNRNGLPNRFFECWSNGLPVITTAGTEVARIVKEENGGIVIDDNSPESIFSAMRFFVENKSQIVTMGLNGRKAVERKYSWQSAYSNLSSFYAKILE